MVDNKYISIPGTPLKDNESGLEADVKEVNGENALVTTGSFTGIYEQVCSELVAYFLRDVLDQPVRWSFDTATPKDIKEFLDSLEDLK